METLEEVKIEVDRILQENNDDLKDALYDVFESADFANISRADAFELVREILSRKLFSS